jgi:hypothetical protein
MQSVVNGDNNLVTVQCGITALEPTNGSPIIHMQATTTHDGILGL